MTDQYSAGRTFFSGPRSLFSLLFIGLAACTILLAGCSDSLVSPEDDIVAPALAQGEAPSAGKAAVSTSAVYTFPGGPDQMLIEGASASLIRTKNGINYRIDTNSLMAGHAYTLWVVIFNDPGSCGTAPDPCTPTKHQWKQFGMDLGRALKLEHDGVKAGAMRMIIQYGDLLEVDHTVVDLMRIYRDHDSDNMRRMAVVALGKTQNRRAMGYLAQAIAFEQSPRVKHTMQAVVSAHRHGTEQPAVQIASRQLAQR